MPTRTPRAHYDAIIVGARCAGAATAMLLARHGLRVLAIDRSAYGADTLSTHALMRAGVMQLARWGVLDAVRAAGTPAVRATSFHYGDDVVDIDIEARDGVDALYAPRRTVLDPVLVDAARAAGAEVRFGVRLIDLLWRGDRVAGVVVEDRDGAVSTIDAGVVIGADGIKSTIARLVDAPALREAHANTATVFGYWAGVDVDRYHWFWQQDAAGGIIPTNGGVCVFVGTNPDRSPATFGPDLERGFHRLLRQVAPAALAGAVAGGERLGNFRQFTRGRGYMRQCVGPGWALVGDAGYFKDPLTAHGITDALRDAELLARAVVADSDTAYAGYQQTRDEVACGFFAVANQIATCSWTIPQVAALHRTMSSEMRKELALIESFDLDFVRATGAGRRAA